MRHRVAHRKLNRTSAHRRALRRSLVSSLIEHENIVTTLPKAKEVKAFAEKLITLAKRDTLSARRRAITLLNERRIVDEDAEHKTIITKLFSVLGPRFANRPGGYTRIVRLAQRRLGDGTPKAVLQFVDQAIASVGVRTRRTTKSGHSKPTAAKSAGRQKGSAPDVPSTSADHTESKAPDRDQPDHQSPESNSSKTKSQDAEPQEQSTI